MISPTWSGKIIWSSWRKSADDGKIFNEAHLHRKQALADGRPHRERTPQVGVPIMGFGDECQELTLVGVRTFRQSDPWNELDQNAIPILPDDVAIGRPVLDDIPEAKEGQKLKSSVRKLEFLVAEFVLELGIANIGDLRDVELLAWYTVVLNRTKTLAKLVSQRRLVCDPVEVGTEVKVALVQFRARIARRNIAQLCDPAQQDDICGLAIRRFEDGGKHTEQLIVPMQIAGCDLRDGDISRIPKPAQGCEILNLHRRKVF